MINFSFSTKDGNYHPQFRLENLQNTWNALLFVVCDLQDSNDWIVSVSSYGIYDESIPNIIMQRESENYFFQIFVDENLSPKSEEGWYSLVGKSGPPSNPPFLIVHDERPIDSDLYFHSLETPEVFFSRNLLVKREYLAGILKHLSSTTPTEWLNEGDWMKLGVM